MNLKGFAAVACIAALVAGCSEYAGPKETSGAVIGGVAGGLLGNTVGHGQGRAAATLLGAALGAVVGGAVGRNLDDVDRQRAYYAAQRSFETGRRQYWDNPRPAIAANSCRGAVLCAQRLWHVPRFRTHDLGRG